MEYCSAIKRKELLIHAATSVSLPRITLSEKKTISQSYMLYDYIYILNYGNWEQIGGCQGLRRSVGGRKWVWTSNSDREILVHGKFWAWTVSVSGSCLLHCTTVLQDVTIEGNWSIWDLTLLFPTKQGRLLSSWNCLNNWKDKEQCRS